MLFVLAGAVCLLRAGALQCLVGHPQPLWNLTSLGMFPNHCQSFSRCFPAGCDLARILVLIVNETMELSWNKKVESGSKNGREEGTAALASCRRFSKSSVRQHLWVTTVLSPVEDQGSADIGRQAEIWCTISDNLLDFLKSHCVHLLKGN